MNRVPLAIDEWCYAQHLLNGGMTHFDVIARAGALGVQGVGLDYFLLPKEVKKEPRKLKDALDKHSLELVLGFGLPFALPSLITAFLKDDEQRFMKIAGKCGVTTVRVVGGVVVPIKGLRPFHLVLSKEAEIREVSKNLKRFSRKLSHHGMRVALEYHMDYTWRQMLDIADRVEEENFGFTLDTGNAVHIGEDPIEAARALAPRSVFTHLKDMKTVGNHAECVALGEGEVDLPGVLKILEETGYQGLYCLENALKPAEKEQEQAFVEKGVSWLKANT